MGSEPTRLEPACPTQHDLATQIAVLSQRMEKLDAVSIDLYTSTLALTSAVRLLTTRTIQSSTLMEEANKLNAELLAGVRESIRVIGTESNEALNRVTAAANELLPALVAYKFAGGT